MTTIFYLNYVDVVVKYNSLSMAMTNYKSHLQINTLMVILKYNEKILLFRVTNNIIINCYIISLEMNYLVA